MIKRFIFFVLFCTVCVFAMAQSQTVTHVVQRGETIESIAKDYHVSVNDINKANPNVEGVIYVGMKLFVPKITTPENTQIVQKQPAKELIKTASSGNESQRVKTEFIKYGNKWRFKAIAGLTIGTWTGKDFKEGSVAVESGSSSCTNKAIYQMHLGVVADYNFSENLYAGIGVVFNQNGYKQEVVSTSGQYWNDEGGNYDGKCTNKMTTNNIEIPVHIGGMYDISSGIRIFAEAGPYASYAISGNKKQTGFFTDYEDIHSSATEYINEKEKLGKGSLKNYQKFGYGISATAGISVSNIIFQFTYQRELSKAIKKAKQYEQNMLFSIGYEF